MLVLVVARVEVESRFSGHHLLLPRLVVRKLNIADDNLLRTPTTARLLLPNQVLVMRLRRWRL